MNQDQTTAQKQSPDFSIAPRVWAFSMLLGGWTAQLIYSAAISNFRLSDTIIIFVVFWFTGSTGFFTGTIFGLLFGIPKTSGNEVNAVRPDGRRRFRVNANIEEISDWLTNIIVGLTLVNLEKVYNFMIAIGGAVSSATVPTGGGTNPGANIIAVASVIYGFTCGFMRFYFWARDLQYDYERRE